MLVLELGARTVTIDRLLSAAHPRVEVGGAEVSYSIAGTPIIGGVQHEPKLFWTVQAEMDSTAYTVLCEIGRVQLLTRPRTPIVLHDFIQPITELSPRTRELATGLDSGDVITSGSAVRYYARYNVQMIGPPKAVKTGHIWDVSFNLAELDKVAP
jgi:hypothetical protein